MNWLAVGELMAHTAHFFGVHSTKVSHRSFPHGFAVDTALATLKHFGVHTGRDQIRSALINGRNWTSAAAYGYLIYDERNINELLPRFRRILKDDPNAVPEDYFIYVSQIGNPANVVHYEDKICDIIAPLLGTLDAAWFINSVVIHHSNPQGPPPKEEPVVEDGKMDEDEFTAQPPLPCCLWKLRKPCHFDNCEKTFRFQSEIDQHVAVEHEGFRFKCDYCGLEMKFRQGRKSHMKYACPERPMDIERIALKCHFDDCEKTFRWQCRLDQHVAAEHEGFRFKCDYCGVEFKRQETLNRHLKRTHRPGAP